MPVYLSMFGILNLAGKLATGIPSKSSQTTDPSDTLICLIHCLMRSMRACVSSMTVAWATTGGVISECPCSI